MIQKEKCRFYMEDESGKLVAEITFPETEPGVFTIDHTFVDPSLRGDGIASQLVQAVVDTVHCQGGKVKATCPYAKNWLSIRNIEC